METGREPQRGLQGQAGLHQPHSRTLQLRSPAGHTGDQHVVWSLCPPYLEVTQAPPNALDRMRRTETEGSLVSRDQVRPKGTVQMTQLDSILYQV